VKIGNQIWMKENLRTTKYNNNTDIPLVTEDSTWDDLTSPGYSWYNNDKATYANPYGALYNWFVVEMGNLCPVGWHVPSDDEWTELTNYLASNGHSGNEGTVLKTNNSWDHNGNGTDDYGFAALPGGIRSTDFDIFNYTFNNIGFGGHWWTSSEDESTDAWGRNMYWSYITVERGDYSRRAGRSIRCIKD